jgi:hypothetical protein
MAYMFRAPVYSEPRAISTASGAAYRNSLATVKTASTLGTDALAQLKREVEAMRRTIQEQERLLKETFKAVGPLKDAVLALEKGGLNRSHTDIPDIWPKEGDLLTFASRSYAIADLATYSEPILETALTMLTEYRAGQLRSFSHIVETVELLTDTEQVEERYVAPDIKPSLATSLENAVEINEETNLSLATYRERAARAAEYYRASIVISE